MIAPQEIPTTQNKQRDTHTQRPRQYCQQELLLNKERSKITDKMVIYTWTRGFHLTVRYFSQKASNWTEGDLKGVGLGQIRKLEKERDLLQNQLNRTRQHRDALELLSRQKAFVEKSIKERIRIITILYAVRSVSLF